MGPVEAASAGGADAGNGAVGSGVGPNVEAGVGKEARTEAGGGAEASVEAEEGRETERASGTREGDTPHAFGAVSRPHASRQPVSICIRGWLGAARHGDTGTWSIQRGCSRRG